MALPGAPANTTRLAGASPRRPWLLIAACLLLVGLTVPLGEVGGEPRARRPAGRRDEAGLRRGREAQHPGHRRPAAHRPARAPAPPRPPRQRCRAALVGRVRGPSRGPRIRKTRACPTPDRPTCRPSCPRPSSSRWFCSAVPIAMRRCPGKPTPAPSRTRMPAWKSAARSAPARSPTLASRKFACEGGEGAPRSASAARSRGRSARTSGASARDARGPRARPPRRPGRGG